MPQHREPSAYLEAVAEAYAASALSAALLPERWLLLAPLPAIALLAASWFARIPIVAGGDAAFAPDPLAPDFRPLLAILADRIEAALAGGGVARIHLMPMLAPDGSPLPYAIDWNPAESSLVATHCASTERRHCGAPVRPAALLPIVVSRHPVSIEARRAPDGRRVLLLERRPFTVRSLFSREPPGFAALAYALYAPTALLLLKRHGVGGGIGPMRIAVAAIAPVVAVRLWAFRTRLRRAVAGNALFAAGLLRRFLRRRPAIRGGQTPSRPGSRPQEGVV